MLPPIVRNLLIKQISQDFRGNLYPQQSTVKTGVECCTVVHNWIKPIIHVMSSHAKSNSEVQKINKRMSRAGPRNFRPKLTPLNF